MAQKKENSGNAKVSEVGKSSVVEKDLKDLEWNEIADKKDKRDNLFYRNFVFKCAKCISEFEHTAKIREIEHRVVCPECNEEHIIRIRPTSKKYDVRIPKTIEVVR